jgi:glutathione S-transferase
MYTLYYLPDACSLATQVVLRELKQPVEIIDKQHVRDFGALNPVGTVPLLVDGTKTLREGAAVMIYLLDKHSSHMLPSSSDARNKAIQDIMFANATMHPAYGRLFFTARATDNAETKQNIFDLAAQSISELWQVVEGQLQNQPFLGGTHVSAADIMLSVYSRWGAGFPVTIKIGKKATQMIEAVFAMPNFQKSLQAEKQSSAA